MAAAYRPTGGYRSSAGSMPPVIQAQDTTIPPDVIDQIENIDPSVADRIRDGVLDQIPEDIADRLPATVVDRLPDGLIESAGADPALLAVLAIVGGLAVIIFVWGVVKSAFKAALFAGVVGAAAWFWFFNAA